MAESNKIVRMGATGISSILGDVDLSQRPDFIPEGDKSGTEGISTEDIRLPRLAIAQGLSPEVVDDNARIEGLNVGQMFNDFTKEIYGRGPIFFVPVRRDVRVIEFRPRSEGGGVIDMNVPRNDPRATDWREVDGKRLPPVATTFHEFVSFLLKQGGGAEPIVISIKMTNKFNRRAATDLNGFIKMHASQGAKSVPIYGVIYSIESRMEKNDKGNFGIPIVKQVGYLPPALREIYERAKDFAEELKTKTIIVEREHVEDDGTDFNPETYDAEVVEDQRR